MPETEILRAFLAVPPDPEWSESAARLVAEIEPGSPPAGWTRPSSWHVTLKFLGAAARDALAVFSRAVGPVAAALSPLDLASAGPAVFPAHGPARVLGIAIGPADAVARIADLVRTAEREARTLGLAREDRAFHPHVTLARIRSRWPSGAVARFRDDASRWPFPAWRARSCVLYSSRLGGAGAVHTPLTEWIFGGAPESREETR
jgi:RNA 2',3'-cyclic 3'-phosphodiesterase